MSARVSIEAKRLLVATAPRWKWFLESLSNAPDACRQLNLIAGAYVGTVTHTEDSFAHDYGEVDEVRLVELAEPYLKGDANKIWLYVKVCEAMAMDVFERLEELDFD